MLSKSRASISARCAAAKASSKVNYAHYKKYYMDSLRKMCLMRGLGRGRSKIDLIEKLLRQDKEHAAKPFRFLDLPAELRNMVYDLITVDNDRPISARTQPMIAATNRQLRKESLAVYYGGNSFLLHTQLVSRNDTPRPPFLRTQSIVPTDDYVVWANRANRFSILMLYRDLLRTLVYDIDVTVVDALGVTADMEFRISIHQNLNAKEHPVVVEVTRLAFIAWKQAHSGYPTVMPEPDYLCGEIRKFIQGEFDGAEGPSITEAQMKQVWRSTPYRILVDRITWTQ